MNSRTGSGLAAVSIVAALVIAACGQKGPLYLPDKGGEVVTRPAGATPGTPQQQPQQPAQQPSPETAPQPATTPPESTTKPDEKKNPPPR
jgi:predicted small lipoprotein YifL